MRLQLNIDLPRERLSFADKAEFIDTLYELLYKRTTADKAWETPFTNIKVDGKFYVTNIKGPEIRQDWGELTEPVITATLLGDVDLIDEDGEVIYRIR